MTILLLLLLGAALLAAPDCLAPLTRVKGCCFAACAHVHVTNPLAACARLRRSCWTAG